MAGETILIVDDEEAIVEITREILETFDYEVITARSGSEAIEIFRARKGEIDLIILDMFMPGMKGDEIVEILAEIDPGVRVIFASGLRLESKSIPVASGMRWLFLQKPFRFDQLDQTIRALLEMP